MSLTSPKRTRGAAEADILEHVPSVDDQDGASKRRRLTATALPSLEQAQPALVKYRGITFRKSKQVWAAQIRYKGKNIDLGGHHSDEAAARAYDKAVINLRGINSRDLNFPAADYSEDAVRLAAMAFEDLVIEIRTSGRDRQNSSAYTGVRKNKGSNQWEAYIRIAGTFLSLGIHKDEKSAAQAYDQAAIIRHAQGVRAVGKSNLALRDLATNFPLQQYQTVFTNSETGNPGVSLLDSKYVQSVLDLCQQHTEALNSFRETAANRTVAPASTPVGNNNNGSALCNALQQIDPGFVPQTGLLAPQVPLDATAQQLLLLSSVVAPNQ